MAGECLGDEDVTSLGKLDLFELGAIAFTTLYDVRDQALKVARVTWIEVNVVTLVDFCEEFALRVTPFGNIV